MKREIFIIATGMKKFISVVLVIFGSLAFSARGLFAQACAPAPVDLVSWWSLDGNALDGRSRNNGTGGGFVAGHSGQGLDSGRVVSVSDDPSLDQQTFTIEGWVTAANYDCAGCAMFIAAKSGSNGQFGWELSVNRNSVTGFAGGVRLSLNGGAGGADLFDPTDITDGSFHHIAATYDGATMKIYVDGALSSQTPVAATINYQANSRFVIGSRQGVTGATVPYNGLIDELSIYNRVLTDAEIAAIHAAGTAGKCKPTATVAPSGLVGWWAGDGDANDTSGNGNNGTLGGDTGFSVGKAGQAFQVLQDTAGSVLSVPDSASLDFTNAFTIEMWVSPAVDAPGGDQAFLLCKGNCATLVNQPYSVILAAANKVTIRIGNNSTIFGVVTSTTSLPLNTFSHIAATFDGATLRIYVNGILENAAAAAGTLKNSSSPLTIGGAQVQSNVDAVRGLYDEVSLYNRALSDTEIAAIFNAGIAGKLKRVDTPTGASIASVVGDTTVTFPSVTTAGTTHEIPIDISSLPASPLGTFTGLAYDVSTSAGFTGSPSICFNVPAFSPTEFTGLRVVHLVGGGWVDVTAGSTFPLLCTDSVSTFSPFAITDIGPSAAGVEISGRVVDARGRGIRGALVSITGLDGNEIITRSNTFGYFRFKDVAAGGSYLLDATIRRYTFEPTLISLTDNVSGIVITATPLKKESGSKPSSPIQKAEIKLLDLS